MTAVLHLSMCSGCTAQYAVQGEPRDCEMPGDNGYTCPACTRAREAREAATAIVAGRSYFLRDGWAASARYVVLDVTAGWATVRRLGFPDEAPLRMPVSELLGWQR